jgi:hypothetical protein
MKLAWTSRVWFVMRLVLIFAVACGGNKPVPTGSDSGSDTGVVKDTRTELEKRRDTGCEQAGERLRDCTFADLKRARDAGEVTQKHFDTYNTPDMRRAFMGDWLKKCRVPMSSRQVRVLEVCLKEEPDCAPFADCLTHLNDKVGK